MKCFGLILVCLALVNCSPEFRINDEIVAEPFLMGGVLAESGQFPSAVFIDILDLGRKCGGTIIHAQHIVTSAECLYRDTTNGLKIVHSSFLHILAGDISLIGNTVGRAFRNVTNIFVHPGFNPYSRENNIAVLRIHEPFQLPDNYVEAAVRRQRIVPIEQECIFAGWGYNSGANIAVSNINLKFISVAILLHDQCNAADVYRGRVRESMICGMGVGIPEAVCHGNEGSGLYCNNQLTGILSDGVHCGQVNRPGIYTQIRFFNDWIDEQVNRNDTPDPSIWQN